MGLLLFSFRHYLDTGLECNITYYYQITAYLLYLETDPTNIVEAPILDCWQIEIVDANANVGPHCSIALDSEGNPHFSYFKGLDAGDGNLLYAGYNPSSGNWNKQTVDVNLRVGKYTSMALDINNVVHIGYYGYIQKNPKYATRTVNTPWEQAYVDSGANLGEYTALALTSTGTPQDIINTIHVSYYDRDNGALKYAICGGPDVVCTNVADWNEEIVEDPTNEDVGKYTSIGVFANDQVHISYYDETNKDLKYVTGTSGAWGVPETVDGAGEDVGMYTSIAIGSDDAIHISYYDESGHCLKYARKDATGWVSETLDCGVGVGEYNSIAIDSQNHIHISYYSSTGSLKYTTNKPGDWVAQTVDSEGNVGQFSSIAVDLNDKVHIGYFDSSVTNLKYATNK